MRLLDLLHPHLDGVTTVVDATGGHLDPAPYLHLPDGTRLLREDEAEDAALPLGPGTLLLVSYGPDPQRHGDAGTCRKALRRLRPGGRGLIVFGHRSAELPYHRLLDDLVAHGCQVLRAGSLDYRHLHGGAVFTRTDELLPVHRYFGGPVPPGPADHTTALRLAGEYVLADFVSRSQRARLLDLEHAAQEAERARRLAAHDPAAEQLAEAVREKERLAAELRRARERSTVLQARVSMLEGSTSLRVGKALVAAARSPVRGSARLPRELYGMWRGRRRSPAPAPARAQAPGPAAGGEDRLLLVHRALAAGPRDRLVIAGVLRPRTAADFAADAVVNRLLPHDGRLLVERTDPDAVVVLLSACTDGGPWAHAGSGAAPDLDRRLHELLTAARVLGRPAVLWRDAPASAAPGLAGLPWDAVLDADTGVRLSALDPAGTGRQALRDAFTTSATRVRLAEVARIAGAPDPLDARRVTVMADPPDPAATGRLVAQVLGQLHRPAEVVVPAHAPGLEELTAGGVPVRAGAPTAPWVADWSDPAPDRPPGHLLDLMCAQEWSGADAVGFTDGGADYAYVPAVAPDLVRRCAGPAHPMMLAIRREDMS